MVWGTDHKIFCGILSPTPFGFKFMVVVIVTHHKFSFILDYLTIPESDVTFGYIPDKY